ncbi:hypothetical protein PGTUg99_000613 [Puccinia graminis f. sp. tritici]|uniref:Uncharacterized protein n=1 Tax=Puccinia graminis f. sp. tritici TaxID=56615 RepID=A0A5B0S9E7_PUCGR|nr:hypothetical protein PGTUg99_000613 [Puccinia graminis f. sp. tritici]
MRSPIASAPRVFSYSLTKSTHQKTCLKLKIPRATTQIPRKTTKTRRQVAPVVKKIPTRMVKLLAMMDRLMSNSETMSPWLLVMH